jgi:hypothetical protein
MNNQTALVQAEIQVRGQGALTMLNAQMDAIKQRLDLLGEHSTIEKQAQIDMQVQQAQQAQPDQSAQPAQSVQPQS